MKIYRGTNFTVRITLSFVVALTYFLCAPIYAQKVDIDATQRLTNVLNGFQRAVEMPTDSEVAAGEELRSKFDAFVGSIVTDTDGNVVAFALSGKNYSPVYDSGVLQGVQTNTGFMRFKIAPSQGVSETNIVMFDLLGRTVGQQSVKMFGTVSPQLLDAVTSMLQLESRSTFEVQLAIEANNNLALGSASRLPPSSHTKRNAWDIVNLPCAESCDAQRDSDSATCDGYFDAEMALVGVLALMASELPPGAPRVAAYAALAAAGLTASYNKAQCKSGAIVSWAICRSTC
jgi:hypothetical protein